MLPAPRIISIDDEPKHLAGLTEGLNRYGAACLPIHFTADTTNIPTCPHVRVIFADLHLSGGPPTDYAKDFSMIGGLIEDTIKPSGPYFIVLWTMYPEQADNLHDYLKQGLQGVAKPFAVKALDKSGHLDANGTVKNPESLVEAIRNVVAGQSSLRALLNWEDRTLDSVSATVSSLLEVAEGTPESASGNEELGRLLASLAAASVGRGHVEEDRFRAVNEALLPILADRMAVLRSREHERDVWQTAFKVSDTNRGLTLSEAARLNRLLHIAPSVNGGTWSERGTVIDLPRRFSGSRFKRTFGLEQEVAAQKQFGARNFEGDSDQLRWVLVQAQAACDYAQTRLALVPFYLGLCLRASDVATGKLPASLWTSPCFELNGETYLHVNAGFQTSLPPTARISEPPLFRLREQLLNDLTYRLHSHAARPGIISLGAPKKRASGTNASEKRQ